MPPEAVASWQGPGDEPDLRRWILGHAILAPHSHNLQSWVVDLSVPDQILLRCDLQRLLPETGHRGDMWAVGMLRMLIASVRLWSGRADEALVPAEEAAGAMVRADDLGGGVRRGGGVVLNPDNRSRLHDTGWVVYLNVPPALLYERTRHDRNRPLLRVPDPKAKLEELHAVRDPLYREIAHLVVDGSYLVASGVVHYLLREFNQLCQN